MVIRHNLFCLFLDGSQSLSDITPTYDSSSIQSLEGLQAMRFTPLLFLPDLEWGGITHCALEIFTNSNDELIACKDAWRKATIMLLRDRESGRMQFLVTDTGRGMPILDNANGSNPFFRCVTKPHTSGKYNQDSYAISGGQFGVGAKVPAATSTALTAISRRPEGVGVIHVKEGVPPPEPVFTWDVHPDQVDGTGVTYYWEPDPTIFSDTEGYGREGYLQVISLLRQLVFFKKQNLSFLIHDGLIPEWMWTETNPVELMQGVNRLVKESDVVWDAREDDGISWIKSYWGITKNFTWIRDIVMNDDDHNFCEQIDPDVASRLVNVVIKFYYIRGDRSGGMFSLVNSVPIPDWRKSDHTRVVLNVVKEVLADHIEDAGIKKFFLSSYQIPLYLAICVDYKGARFSNATKTAWVDDKFRAVYHALVEHWLREVPEGQKIMDSLFDLLENDIIARYNDSLGTKTTARDMTSLRARLKDRSKRFSNAEPSDGNRMACELFLLEGNSTGGGEDYDTEHQGIYFMQGKPRNIIRGTNGNRSEAIRQFLANEVLSDICTIINYDPRHPNLDNLNFGRVCITPDADKRTVTIIL